MQDSNQVDSLIVFRGESIWCCPATLGLSSSFRKWSPYIKLIIAGSLQISTKVTFNRQRNFFWSFFVEFLSYLFRWPPMNSWSLMIGWSTALVIYRSMSYLECLPEFLVIFLEPLRCLARTETYSACFEVKSYAYCQYPLHKTSFCLEKRLKPMGIECYLWPLGI